MNNRKLKKHKHYVSSIYRNIEDKNFQEKTEFTRATSRGYPSGLPHYYNKIIRDKRGNFVGYLMGYVRYGRFNSLIKVRGTGMVG